MTLTSDAHVPVDADCPCDGGSRKGESKTQWSKCMPRNNGAAFLRAGKIKTNIYPFPKTQMSNNCFENKRRRKLQHHSIMRSNLNSYAGLHSKNAKPQFENGTQFGGIHNLRVCATFGDLFWGWWVAFGSKVCRIFPYVGIRNPDRSKVRKNTPKN